MATRGPAYDIDADVNLFGKAIYNCSLFPTTTPATEPDLITPFDGAMIYWNETNNRRIKFYDTDLADWATFTRPDIDETVSGQYSFTSSGSPFLVTSTTLVSNLNADLLDGYNTSLNADANTVAVRGTGGRLAVADPVASTDAVNLQYLTDVVNSIDRKESVLCATTSNITLSGLQTIDGVALGGGDRVLVKDQTTKSQNGIYDASSGAWTRSADLDETSEADEGVTVWVRAGTTHADQQWTIYVAPGTLGVNDMEWTQTNGANLYTAGKGMVLSGTVIHFATASDYAAGDLFYASGTSAISRLGIGGANQVLHTNGSAISWGAVDLTADVTGTLPVTKGGTGTANLATEGAIYFSGSGSVFTTDSANLFYDNSGNRLGLRTASPSAGYVLDVNGTSDRAAIFRSTVDTAISLVSTNTWTGISFTDVGGTDQIYYYGATQTFAIGGGGSTVSGKKLHVDGGTTIGVNYDASSVATNGLGVEGSVGIKIASAAASLHVNADDMIFGTSKATKYHSSNLGGWTDGGTTPQYYTIGTLDLSGNDYTSVVIDGYIGCGRDYQDNPLYYFRLKAYRTTGTLTVEADVEYTKNSGALGFYLDDATSEIVKIVVYNNHSNQCRLHWEITERSMDGVPALSMVTTASGNSSAAAPTGYTAITNNNYSRNLATGYFGIKTTNPTGDFSVANHLVFDDSTRLLTITNTGNAGGINFVNGNSRIYFSGYRTMEGSTDGSNLTIGEGYSQASFINSIVSIGNTASSSKLSVKDSSDSGFNHGIHIIRSANADSGYISMQGGALSFNTVNNAGSGATPIQWAMNGVPKMKMDTSGNLVIGTDSITSGFRLDVVGADFRVSDVSGDDGVEIGWSAGSSVGFVQAYDRLASSFRTLTLNNAMHITASGNVGINETDPDGKLHVGGSIRFTGSDIVATANAGVLDFASGYARFWALGSNATTRDNGIQFVVAESDFGNSITAMTIDGATGNVGIGESSSIDARLHVVGPDGAGTTPTVNADTVAIFENSAGSTNSSMIQIIAGASGRSTIQFSDTAAQGVGQVDYDHSTNELSFATNGTADRLLIDSSGNVVIGASSTTRDFEVVRTGSADMQLTSLTSGNASFLEKGYSATTNVGTGAAQGGGNIQLYNLDATDGNFNGLGFYNSNSLIVAGILGINVSHVSRHGALVFQTHNGTTLLERGRIDKDGNWGIGSILPTTDGPTIAQKLVIKATGSTGITVSSPDANNATYNFGSVTDNDYAYFQGYYNAGSPFVRGSIVGTEVWRFSSEGLTISGDLDFTGAGRDILMVDNSGAALEFKEGANVYQRFVTTNGAERIDFYKNTYFGALVSGSSNSVITENLGVLEKRTINSGVWSSYTQGSVIFAGASGIYSQDNTGLFFDAANNRLSIGHNSPAKTLDVLGTSLFKGSGANIQYDTGAAADGRFEFLYNGTREALIGVNSNAFIIQGDTGTTLKLYTGAYTTQLVLATSGKVGILNDSPDETLDVSGTARFTGKTSVGNSSRTAMLDVRSDTGEAFRVDVAAAAYRIVADQTGVNLQGTVNLATLASSSSNSVLTENAGNIEKRTINAGVWTTNLGANRLALTNSSGELTSSGSFTYSGPRIGVVSAIANTATLAVSTIDDPVTANSTTYERAIVGLAQNCYDISTGVTDSGYRVAIHANVICTDADFQGTLASQYGVWVQHGIYSNAAAGATITNSYGIRIDSYELAGTTVSNFWALYQSNSAAKNYFAGSVSIGSTEALTPLHVVSNTGSNFISVQDMRSNTGDLAGIRFSTSANTTTNFKSFIAHIETGSNGVGDMVFAINNSLLAEDATISHEVMRLDKDGKLGIGTNPGTTLDVVSDNANPIRLYRNGVNASLQTQNSVTSVYFGVNTSGNACIGHLLDQTNAPFQMNASGNIGVGVVPSSRKLEVSGSIGLTGTNTYLIGGDGEILAGQDSGGYYLFAGFGAAVAKGIYIGDNATAIICKTGNINRMTIDTNGTQLTTLNSSTTSNSIIVEESGVLKKRTINSGAWGTLDTYRFALSGGAGQLTTSSDFTYTSSGAACFGGAASTGDRLRVYIPDVTVDANGTNYRKAIYAIGITGYDIATGVTDSGYRIALDASVFVSDTDFEGTLTDQYAVWARHGANVSGVGSTITNSYGVYIDSLTTANTTITNLWGLYQASSVAKNYFAGSVAIGTSTINHVFTVNANSGAAGKPIAWIHNSGNFTGYDGTVISTVNDGSDAEVLHVRTNNTTYNNGTSLMLVRGDGRVGIGTTDPDELLHLSATTASDLMIQSTGVDSYARLMLKNDARQWNILVSGTQGDRLSFYDATALAYRMVIDSSGNVGIGNPAESGGNGALGSAQVTLKVGITNASIGYSVIQSRGYTSTADGIAGALEFIDDRNGTDDCIGRIVSSRGGNGIGSGNLRFYTASTAGVLAEKMRITGGGNVGIGTTVPDTPLHVYRSTTDSTGAGRTTALDVLTIESENTAAQEFTGFGQNIVFKGSTYNQTTQRVLGRISHRINDDSVTTTRGTSLLFQTLDDATTTNAPTTKLIIDYAGRVGIGTTSPDHLLHLSKTSAYASATEALLVVSYDLSDTPSNTTSFTSAVFSGDITHAGMGYLRFEHAYNTFTPNRWSAIQAGSNYPVYGDGPGPLAGDTPHLLLNPYGGNVGIGTTSPAALFHSDKTGITTDSSAEVARFQGTVTGDTTNTHLRISSAVSGSTVANRYVSLQVYDHNPTARALVLQPSGGNVGIGTTSPDAVLDVNADTDLFVYLGRAWVGNAEGSYNDWAAFGHFDQKSAGGLALAQNATGITRINAASTKSIQFGIAGVYNSQFDATGLGIGAAPTYQLHVTHPSSGAAVLGLTGVGGSKDTWTINSTDASANSVLTFRDEDTSTTVMALKQNGNVGIGTTTPGQKLTVENTSGSCNALIRGSSQGSLVLEDTGAGVNEKITQFVSDGGIAKFRALTDVYGISVDNMLAFDLSSGNVGIGTTSTSTLLTLFKSGSVAGETVDLVSFKAPGSSGTSAFNVAKIVADTNGSTSANSYISIDPINTNGTGYAQGLCVHAGGNVGIGTTDIESWNSAHRAIEFYGSALMAGNAGTDIYLLSGAYYDGAWKHKLGSTAESSISLSSGTIKLRVHEGGTVGTSFTWTDALTIENDGNIGIGTTDIENWSSSYRAIQFPYSAIMAGASTRDIWVTSNYYFDGAHKYRSTGPAAYYAISASGSHLFRVAASGTTDTAITWTNALTIENDGDVGIGVSPSSKFHVQASSGSTTTATIENTHDSNCWVGIKGSGSTVFVGNNGGKFAVQTSAGGYSNSLTVDTAGATNILSPLNIWNTVGPNSLSFVRETYFGYSSSYKILEIGKAESTRAISIGHDSGRPLSSNAGSGFDGKNIIFPIDRNVITPNNANTSYLGLFGISTSEVLHIGSSNYNVINGGRVRITLSTGEVWLDGPVTINDIDTSSTHNNVLVEDNGLIKRRTIYSGIWDGKAQELAFINGSSIDFNTAANGLYQRYGGVDWSNDPAGVVYGVCLSQTISGNRGFQMMFDIRDGSTSYGDLHIRTLNLSGWATWRKLWHDGNDGAGSGLDADLLDGQHGSYYTTATNIGGLTASQVVLTDGSGKLTSGLDLPSTVTIGNKSIARKYTTTMSGASTSYVITHNLGTKDIEVTLRKTSTDKLTKCAAVATTTNSCTISFIDAKANGEYEIIVIG